MPERTSSPAPSWPALTLEALLVAGLAVSILYINPQSAMPFEESKALLLRPLALFALPLALWRLARLFRPRPSATPGSRWDGNQELGMPPAAGGNDPPQTPPSGGASKGLAETPAPCSHPYRGVQGGSPPLAAGGIPNSELHPTSNLAWRSVLGGASRAPLVGAMLLGLYLALWSALLGVSPADSLFGANFRGQGVYTQFAGVVLFLAALGLGGRAGRRERLLLVLCLLGSAAAFFGLLQPLGMDLNQAETARMGGRVWGTVGNPIFLGAVLLMTLPLTLGLGLSRLVERRASRFLSFVLLGLAALQAAALLLTESRGPLLGAVAGLLIAGLALGGSRARRLPAVCCLGVGGALLGLILIAATNAMPLGGLEHMPPLSRFRNIEVGTSNVRLHIWKGVRAILAAEPARQILGFGPETLSLVMPRFKSPLLFRIENPEAVADRAHNLTYDLLAGRGVLGLVAWLLVLALFVRLLLRRLGLLHRPRQDLLLVGLEIGGFVAGWFAPGWALAEPALAGPVAGLGFAAGIVAYLAMAGLFPRSFAGAGWPAKCGLPEALLLAAILGAAVGHFVELQFGFEILGTQALYYVLAGLTAAWIASAGDKLATAPNDAPNDAPDDAPDAATNAEPDAAADVATDVVADTAPVGEAPSATEQIDEGLALASRREPSSTAVSSADGNAEPDVEPDASAHADANVGPYAEAGAEPDAEPDAETRGARWFPLYYALLSTAMLTYGTQWAWRGKWAWGLAVGGFYALTALLFALQAREQGARAGLGRLLAPCLAGVALIMAAQVGVDYGLPGLVAKFEPSLFRFFLQLCLMNALIVLAVFGLAGAYGLFAAPRPAGGRRRAAGALALCLLLGLPVSAAMDFTRQAADLANKAGDEYGRMRNWPAALANYQLAVRLEPSQPWRHHNLGVLAFQAAQDAPDHAEELFEQTLRSMDTARQLSPLNTVYARNLARAAHNWALSARDQRLRLQRLAATDRFYAQAAQSDANNPFLFEAWAQAAIMLGNQDAALQRLSKALELDPKHASARFRLAQILASRGQLDLARDQARQALDQALDQGGNKDDLRQDLKAFLAKVEAALQAKEERETSASDDQGS